MESTSLIWDLLAKDLLYPLSVKYRAGKVQDPAKMLKIQCYFALCFYKNFSETTFIAPKIVFIKKTLISYKSLLC